MMESHLYLNITMGFIISTMLMVSARFLRSRSGPTTAFELAQACVGGLLGLLLFASAIGMIVLNHTGSPALWRLLDAAETPLLVATGGFLLLGLARLLWVFVRRESLPPDRRQAL